VIARWCLAAAVVFPCLGCAPIRMARECQTLSEIVESGQRDLQLATRPDTAAAYRAAGALYEKIAKKLRLAAGSIQLRAPAEDHARTIEAMAPSVNAYADALDSGDAQRIEAARGELERASRREQRASRRLAAECQGRF
jgi:hypothetical protein